VGVFAALIGLTISGAAADGLVVEYARAEPEEHRGSAQALCTMVTLCGTFLSGVFSGLGFNGKMFTGSFDQDRQLSYGQYISVYVVLAMLVAFACVFSVRELPSRGVALSIRDLCSSSWNLLQSKCFFAIMLFAVVNRGILGIRTNASIWVELQWASVKMVQNQCSLMLGVLTSLFGCWLTRRFLLNVSWRKSVLSCSLLVAVIDATGSLPTIFAVVRNPYFYVGEPIAADIPMAVIHLVSLFIANELADDSNCALVAGLFSSANCVAGRLAMLLSNQTFSFFSPSLTLRQNYVDDTDSFRKTVAMSYVLSYSAAVLALVFLPLLPSQKQDARDRKRTWTRHPCYAAATLLLLLLAFVYTLVGDFVALQPSLSCLHFVGGQGC